MQCYPRAFVPRATLHNFGAKFFSVDLGTSQYLYSIQHLWNSRSQFHKYCCTGEILTIRQEINLPHTQQTSDFSKQK